MIITVAKKEKKKRKKEIQIKLDKLHTYSVDWEGLVIVQAYTGSTF